MYFVSGPTPLNLFNKQETSPCNCQGARINIGLSAYTIRDGTIINQAKTTVNSESRLILYNSHSHLSTSKRRQTVLRIIRSPRGVLRKFCSCTYE
jgi:hypothetical protein